MAGFEPHNQALVIPIYIFFSVYNRVNIPPMGRKKGGYKTKRVPLTVIEPTYKILEILVATGGYGNNPTEAVRVILMDHLRKLDDAAKIDLFKGAGKAEPDTK